MTEISCEDIRLALEVLCLSNMRQLKYVEKILKFDLDRCKIFEEKVTMRRALSMLYLIESQVSE